jgi:hypothetical protein
MSTETRNRTHYIFIDYENIQEFDLDLIAGKPVKVFLVVGSKRKTMPMELTKQLMRFGEQVKWIESEGASRNALDLVLTYHVGQQVKADSNGYFHIISKDKDYDALIKHLRVNKVLANRDEVFAKIPALVDFKKLSLEQRVAIVIDKFKNPKVTRPAKKKTLLSSIRALLRKELSATEDEQVLDAMVKKKVIEISPAQAVIYKF